MRHVRGYIRHMMSFVIIFQALYFEEWSDSYNTRKIDKDAHYAMLKIYYHQEIVYGNKVYSACLGLA